MRISDFILLSEAEKRSTVLHQGVLVAKRSLLDHIVFLFQMSNYYVEAYCNTRNKAVEEYRVFDNTSPLLPYLETIAIDGLVQ